MAGGGSKRRSATASASASASAVSRKKSKLSSPAHPLPPPLPLTAVKLAPVLRLVASAVSFSLRFLLSDADLLLLPSQTLALDSAVSSAAGSLSGLLSLIPHIDRPSLRLSPVPSPSPWFLRFLSSSAGGGAADRRWLDAFRMSKRSFDLLLCTLSPSLPSDAADRRLGAALYRLAHAAPYSALARRFGLPSPAAACRAFYEVCRAIATHLGHLFALAADVDRVIRGFDGLSLPNCCGALGFARFSVDGAARSGAVIAQALVDAEGRFLDVSVGWHGAMAPADIVVRTKLAEAQASVLGIGSPLELEEGSVPRYLLGDSCCPLLSWLLTPFRGVDSNANSSKDEIFNNVHAQGMELVDAAFGSLRARWQLLQMCWKEECTEALSYVVIASCLLHNYLIQCSEPMPDEFESSGREPKFPDFQGKGDEGGEKIREVLAVHLSLMGNREDITEGKKIAAQEGFNAGLKQSAHDGYKWGFVRGITSALESLPDKFKEKLIKKLENRDRFQSLYTLVLRQFLQMRHLRCTIINS